MKMPPSPDQVRARLSQLADHNGKSLAELSRIIGRNGAYLQQFVKRGTPRKLAEDDRALLAKYFGVNERELGARDPYEPWTR